jgi:3-oxoacyl-[acyl-carrier protein] reductase
MPNCENKILLITGTSRGIGRYLVEYYAKKNFIIIGCSLHPVDFEIKNYHHFCLDVTNEKKVKEVFSYIRKEFKRLDVLINNAGIASMNHTLLTPFSKAQEIIHTNFLGTFLFSREAAKLMKKRNSGRIVNIATVAVPLKLEGEAVYASSKAAVISFTEILSRELSFMGITVNALGPTPIQTDLIRSVPKDKLEQLLKKQAIQRFGEFRDVSNVIDFFIQPESDFITGQVIYLGGV